MNAPGYEQLAAVLNAAFDQAAVGKGAERHANDLPFHEQRMLGISELLDSDGGLAYQACKKVAEARGMEHDARERELLGAINYIAGMVIFYRKRAAKRHPMTPNVIGYPAVEAGLDVRFDQTGRQENVEQNGNDGAVYPDLPELAIQAGSRSIGDCERCQGRVIPCDGYCEEVAP